MANGKTVKVRQRWYSQEDVNRLYALSAGRCEFRGCNKFTLRHEPTQQDGNYAEKAHIYAFGKRGPRPAPEGTPTAVLNGIDNIMLLCQACHKRIDDNEDTHPVESLREAKKEHEDRVYLITGFTPDYKTKPLAFLANIVKDVVTVSDGDVFTSLFPSRYPSCKLNPLDLSSLVDSSEWYGSAGQSAIQAHITDFYRESPSGRPSHVSVYAIGPIPLLIQFGSSLSNKITTDFYQKHRVRNTWKWSDGEGVALYETKKIQDGTAPNKVALILSLSGKIHLGSTGIAPEFSVYEIEVKDGELAPNFSFLKTRADLDRFRKAYADLVSRLGRDHAGVTEIHLYPAIPAPVAVTCGFDLLPKVHPNLVIYDADKTKGGFNQSLIVTRH